MSRKRMATVVVARKWGQESMGIVIPIAVVRLMDIKAGETLSLTISKVEQTPTEVTA